MASPRAPRGIQAELLASLGLVMVLSSAVLGALLVAHHERSLRELAGRALVAEAHAPAPALHPFVPGTRWWSVDAAGHAEARTPQAGAIDAEARALADAAREAGSPLLRPGPPWDAIRVAVPERRAGRVAVAVLPREASFRLRFAALGVLGIFLAAAVAIFAALGATLLRRRVILPLQRLAGVARALAAGEEGVRASGEGTAETAALAQAMNEMTDALGRRTRALEKAVADLRGANRELRSARQGLARAERLAAVGRLAAGVAHEVGNPIGAILALVDLAGRDAGLSAEARAHLERAGREGLRVRTILRQLLDFARPPRPAPGPVDLAAAAEQAVALVAAQRRYAPVAFRVERAPGTPAARGDPGAVAQILMNLLLNAGDALLGRPCGQVRLAIRPGSAERRRGDPAGAPPPPRRHPDAVECEVADDGAGIDPADAERIFDPFFTTKPPGEGTGLGLANAALLAEELGGSLDLAPAPEGFRTAFVLRLPVWEEGPGAQAARGEATPQPASDPATGFAAEAAASPGGPGQSSSGTPR
jgi:signal transduction histidine kinase